MKVICVFFCLFSVAVGTSVLQLANDLNARTFASLVAKAGLSHPLNTQGIILLTRWFEIMQSSIFLAKRLY